MFNLFKKVSKNLENPSIKTIKDIQKLSKTMEASALGELLRKYAEEGNLVCLDFLLTSFLITMDDPNMTEKQLEKVKKDFVYYAEIAAKLGDTSTISNLGLFYIKQINVSDKPYYEDYSSEDIENLKKSIFWKKASVRCGNDQSLEEIQNLEDFLNDILRVKS